MRITEAAIAAAARIGEHHAGVFQNGGCLDHWHVDSFECVAEMMLKAAAPHPGPLEPWDVTYSDAFGEPVTIRLLGEDAADAAATALSRGMASSSNWRVVAERVAND